MYERRYLVGETLFRTLIDLPKAEREAVLDARCTDDVELRRYVERLLENYDRAQGLPSLWPRLVESTTPESRLLLDGQSLGRYFILERLGSGGMGEVYRGHDRQLDRMVAIKVLRSAALADQTLRDQLRHEALTLSRLDHPNIATVFDLDTMDGIDYLVMEYVAGGSVRDLVAEGPVPIRRALELSQQLAEGLAAAHARGIVHGDLKPDNLGLSEEGHLKILDFGLARLFEPGHQTRGTDTNVTRILGTPEYMSPELLLGARRSRSSDLYGLGVVVYEMVVGRRPTESGAPDPTPWTPQDWRRISPKRQRPETPVDLDRLVARLMAPRAEDRLDSARDVAAKLERIRSGRRSSWLDRRRLVTPVAVVVLLVAAFALFGPITSWLRSQVGSAATSDVAKLFREDFRQLLSLEHPRGFRILDFEGSLWDQNTNNGTLTLFTHHADPWGTLGQPNDSPHDRLPRNIVLRDLNAEKFVVSAVIDSFWPTQNYQQAGLVVCSDDRFDDYLRLTVTSGDRVTRVTAVLERRGEVTQEAVVLWESASRPVENLTIRIIRDGTTWRCEYVDPRNEKMRPILVEPVRAERIEPRFAGLWAFHGNMYDGDGHDRLPRDLPPVAARFREFSIEPYPRPTR